MINLLLKIYQAFEDNADVFTSLGLKPVQHIDRFRGQPLNPEQFEYFDLPAIFINWKIKWQKAGKFYDGVVTLDFHVVTDPTWETSTVSTNREAGLKDVLLHTAVRYVLDDLESEDTSKLQRVDEEPVDTGVVNYSVMRYECGYNDPMTSGSDYIEVLIEKLNLLGKLMKNLN